MEFNFPSFASLSLSPFLFSSFSYSISFHRFPGKLLNHLVFSLNKPFSGEERGEPEVFTLAINKIFFPLPCGYTLLFTKWTRISNNKIILISFRNICFYKNIGIDFYTWRDHVTFYRLFKGMEFSREIISKAQLGASFFSKEETTRAIRFEPPSRGGNWIMQILRWAIPSTPPSRNSPW